MSRHKYGIPKPAFCARDGGLWLGGRAYAGKILLHERSTWSWGLGRWLVLGRAQALRFHYRLNPGLAAKDR